MCKKSVVKKSGLIRKDFKSGVSCDVHQYCRCASPDLDVVNYTLTICDQGTNSWPTCGLVTDCECTNRRLNLSENEKLSESCWKKEGRPGFLYTVPQAIFLKLQWIWDTFHTKVPIEKAWLIVPDYQSRRCCPPFKCEKSHSPKVHHLRAAPNRSWPNLLSTFTMI